VLLVLIQVAANAVGFLVLLPQIFRDVASGGSFSGPADFASVGIIANSIGFGLVTWLTWRKTGMPGRSSFPLVPVTPAAWLGLLLTLGGGLLVMDTLSNLLVRALPPPAWIVDLFRQFLGDEPGLLSFIFLVIVAPVTEEFFFRGVLQQSFRRRYGPNRAIVYAALLFGLVHLIPWQVVPATGLGLLFGWWTERTGSLWPALVAHALTNATAFFLNMANPGADPLAPTSPPLWLAAAGLLVLVSGIRLSQRFVVRPGMAVAPAPERSLS
jgi:membrane protease YdiL (CAAX protease family)